MAKKNKRGAKCKYDEYVKPHLEWIKEQIKNGVTEKAIAEALQITEPTLNKYKKDFPELAEALKADKGAGVLDRLINSGVEAACGQWVTEERIIVQLDEAGRPTKRQKETIKKYIPPNPTLNQYYTKHYGKEKGFTGDPLELELKRAKLAFDKAVQGKKDWEEYE